MNRALRGEYGYQCISVLTFILSLTKACVRQYLRTPSGPPMRWPKPDSFQPPMRQRELEYVCHGIVDVDRAGLS